ncbi:expressed unknown protein [Seminavis robusta]|uniref:BTB domain-containing protein n=1 Tax=Seminavis robusta TaxID=568900 RepID=A0A9N8EY89_9STRA|nr:expressed unknown protein [Seminavis robusta]|eukprot:Sro2509_g329780.1 n/a (301) ;mRNA; r:6580-7601
MSSTSSNNKRSKEGGSSDDEPPLKRPEWADIVVVVGGTPCFESSHILRASSGYFDAAFRFGTKKFDFPDKDPEEWKRLKGILEPFSETMVSNELHHMAKGLKLCDAKLKSVIMESAAEDFDRALKYLLLSYAHNLQGTKETSCSMILQAFQSKSLRGADKMLSSELLTFLMASEIQKATMIQTIQKSKSMSALRSDLQASGILTRDGGSKKVASVGRQGHDAIGIDSDSVEVDGGDVAAYPTRSIANEAGVRVRRSKRHAGKRLGYDETTGPETDSEDEFYLAASGNYRSLFYSSCNWAL